MRGAMDSKGNVQHAHAQIEARIQALIELIDERQLMVIARNLPPAVLPEWLGYEDGIEREYDGDTISLSIFSEMRDALLAYIRTDQLTKARPTFDTVRDSLDRLGSALAQLAAAWHAADWRAQDLLYRGMGKCPFDDVEARPIAPLLPDDERTRGEHRIEKFSDGANRLVAAVKAAQSEIEPEPGRKGYPGLDGLVRCLAAIFETRGRRQFTTSRNPDEGYWPGPANATAFVTSVVAALPEELRPGSGSIASAVERVSAERRIKRSV
jgi:hypothetical protein